MDVQTKASTWQRRAGRAPCPLLPQPPQHWTMVPAASPSPIQAAPCATMYQGSFAPARPRDVGVQPRPDPQQFGWCRMQPQAARSRRWPWQLAEKSRLFPRRKERAKLTREEGCTPLLAQKYIPSSSSLHSSCCCSASCTHTHTPHCIPPSTGASHIRALGSSPLHRAPSPQLTPTPN